MRDPAQETIKKEKEVRLVDTDRLHIRKGEDGLLTISFVVRPKYFDYQDAAWDVACIEVAVARAYLEESRLPVKSFRAKVLSRIEILLMAENIAKERDFGKK